MKRPLTLAALGMLAILVANFPARAAILYSNAYDPASTNAYSSWFQEPNLGGTLHTQTFTDFYVTPDLTITDFHWWGVKWGDVFGFDFEIWSNDGPDGRPGTLVYSEFVADNAGETFVETNGSYGFDVYSYGIDLSTAFTTASAGNYWFSVVAHSPFSWFWAQGANQDFDLDWQHTAIDEAPSDSWQNPNDYEGVDFAFQVTGAAVPEPATLTLVGLGLAGAAIRQRRKAKGRSA